MASQMWASIANQADMNSGDPNAAYRSMARNRMAELQGQLAGIVGQDWTGSRNRINAEMMELTQLLNSFGGSGGGGGGGGFQQQPQQAALSPQMQSPITAQGLGGLVNDATRQLVGAPFYGMQQPQAAPGMPASGNVAPGPQKGQAGQSGLPGGLNRLPFQAPANVANAMGNQWNAMRGAQSQRRGFEMNRALTPASVQLDNTIADARSNARLGQLGHLAGIYDRDMRNRAAITSPLVRALAG